MLAVDIFASSAILSTSSCGHFYHIGNFVHSQFLPLHRLKGLQSQFLQVLQFLRMASFYNPKLFMLHNGCVLHSKKGMTLFASSPISAATLSTASLKSASFLIVLSVTPYCLPISSAVLPDGKNFPFGSLFSPRLSFLLSYSLPL